MSTSTLAIMNMNPMCCRPSSVSRQEVRANLITNKIAANSAPWNDTSVTMPAIWLNTFTLCSPYSLSPDC